ncbi:hypothetical protein ACFQ8E_15050 [Isoptericola sp. NPDC056573]|uniref:hypothetical protein n=1 Tax=Isoptericola sp. NPDC056573 TaxID=3345868 RepID=UPI0036855983
MTTRLSHPLSRLIAVSLSTALLTAGIGPATAATGEESERPPGVDHEQILDAARENVGVDDTEELVDPDHAAQGLEFETDQGAVVIDDTPQGVAIDTGDVGPAIGLPVDGDLDDVDVLDDGTVVLSDEDVEVAVSAHDDGAVRAETIIHDSSAPTEYSYQLSLPKGVSARMAPDGGVDLYESFPDEDVKLLVSRFEPPWAIDANGRAIDTRYELRGTRLAQVVEHTSATTAYPVVADPFWIPAIVTAIRAGVSVVIKTGSRSVKYVKAPASRAVNALKSYKTLSYRAGKHVYKFDKSAMKHVLQRHHPRYWTGTVKSGQTFFHPGMSVNNVRGLALGLMKKYPKTLAGRGTNTRIALTGRVNGVNLKMVIDKGRVVQMYPTK